MKDIITKAFTSPVIILELLSTTILANILSLSSSIFVILVLNRYVSYGLDGTLITLTVGVIIAVILEYFVRRLRFRFAARTTLRRSTSLSTASFQKLISGDERAINSLSRPVKRRMIADSDSIDGFYSPSNLCILLDTPFAFLFILVIYVADEKMALIVAVLCGVYFLCGIFWSFSSRVNSSDTEQMMSRREQLVDSATRSFDLLRLFGLGKRILNKWMGVQTLLGEHRLLQQDRASSVQAGVRFLGALMTITVIAVGAGLVVDGSMSIGVLIGVNILAARAAMPILAFTQLVERHAKQKTKMKAVKRFVRLPNAQEGELELSGFTGFLNINQLEFGYLGATTPILKDLTLQVGAGDVLVVRGKNGSGKTTLAHLICGILSPVSGKVLVDDINLRQINFDWWRKQIVYMPQEPIFYDASILENFQVHKEGATVQEIRHCMHAVGLGELCEETDQGLNFLLLDGGKNLSVGVRRRLALARSLLYDGALVILDEPTENLDLESRHNVYSLLNEFVQKQKTIVCFSLDPEIIKGASLIFDLDDEQVIKKITPVQGT